MYDTNKILHPHVLYYITSTAKTEGLNQPRLYRLLQLQPETLLSSCYI